jgi:hypothetical protein
MKYCRLLIIVAALSVAGFSTSYAASVGNQSEGSNIRDNPVIIGGVRADGKAQMKAESVTAKTSATTVASLAVKATPGTLYWLFVVNGAGATNYVQVHNAATLPANTAVPLATVGTLAASASGFYVFNPGLYCSTGIVVAKSTTAATLTAGAADALVISAGYR